MDVGQSVTYSIDLRNPTQRLASISFDSPKNNSYSVVVFPPVATLKPKEYLNVCVTLTPFASTAIDTTLDVHVKC